jgi:DNA invertase Pin-like site-specific DNA recombinase
MRNAIAGKIAVYLRQSLDRDGSGAAVDRQRAACLDLIKRNGWDTGSIAEYCDNDRSASKGVRPEYQAMLADVDSGAIGAVVVYHLDRLHRQPAELEAFITLADKRAVQLATVTGEVDLSTDQGRLIARIMGAVARAEVERKSARQKLANRQKAQNGKGCTMRSFGYVGNELHPVEAEAILKASNELLDGATLYGIAKRWNDAGLITVNGGQWSGTDVRQVLTRPRNAGLAVYAARKSYRPGMTLKQRIDASIVEAEQVAWPAIVSRDLFDAVVAHLSNPARHTGKRHSNVFLLSGLAVCGECGRKLGTGTRGSKSGPRRDVYQCKTMGCGKITRDVARTDAVVVGAIVERLSRPDAAELFARQGEDTKALAADVNKARELIAAAERDYAQGLIEARDLKALRDAQRARIEAFEARLVGARQSSKLAGLIGRADAAARFAKLDLTQRRTVVDTLVKVTVRPTGKRGAAFDPELIEVDWRS